VWRQLPADQHRRGAPADRADRDGGRTVSRLDERHDLDDLDHEHVLIVRRHPLRGLRLLGSGVLGHVGLVRGDLGQRFDRLERDQRLALKRDVGRERRRDPQRRDLELRRKQLGVGQRRHGPALIRRRRSRISAASS
jgi:hypothetical protein